MENENDNAGSPAYSSCDTCEKQGLTPDRIEVFQALILNQGALLSTFFDAEKRMHRHGDNTTVTYYGCSLGHSWKETRQTSSCPVSGCENRSKTMCKETLGPTSFLSLSSNVIDNVLTSK